MEHKTLVTEKIGEIIRQIIGLERQIEASEALGDVGLDSLSLVTLFVTLEDDFGIEFQPADLIAENFENINSIYSLLDRTEQTNQLKGA